MAAPLLTVDGPWLLYRSFYAMPDSITDGQGRPVNALLGTINTILAAIDATSPRAVVVCFGREDAPYRVGLYPKYHAQRPPVPAPLAAQWDVSPELLERFGWGVLGTDELEADDLLFSLAVVEQEAGGEALILTADRDLFQAVSERVSVLEFPRGGGRGGGGAAGRGGGAAGRGGGAAGRGAGPVRVGPAEVRRRYGVGPEQVPDFIALRGDPSDGLPGARGIGAKTARDLLLEYGSLEEAIAGSYRQRPRVGEALRTQADELRTFREIATLVRVPVKRPPDRPTDYAAGAEAVLERGMRRLGARLERLAGGG